jgi:hypothetical protein
MSLQKHSFWEIVSGAENFEYFIEQYVPSFYFNARVSEEVVKGFGIVEKLLIHSYYEYDFLDPAMAKALTTLEMALKNRYLEITAKKWKGNLQHLLYYFNDWGYFEFDRKGLLDALRNTRNEFSHPEKAFGGGFGMMKVFYHCVGLINDSYEDIQLRKHRTEEKERINIFLEFLLGNGATAVVNEAPYIIYEAKIYFINNALPVKTYYGFYKTIFRLKEEQDENNGPTGSLVFFETTAFETDEINLLCKIGVDGDRDILISRIEKEENQERFDKWTAKYKDSQEDIILDFSMGIEIDKKWATARKQLHCQVVTPP